MQPKIIPLTTTMGAGQEQLWRQYVIAGIASTAVLCTGYAMGWSSPVNEILGNVELSPLPEAVTLEQEAWIGSLLTLGSVLGPFFAGIGSFTIGRKWSLLCSCIPAFIGWLLIALATSPGIIYAGRFVGGVGMGMVFVLAPMYCAEIATVEARSALGSFCQTFLTFGFLPVYAIGPFVSYSAIAYVGFAFVALFFVAFFFMPESPIYYLIKDNRESAADALAKLRGRTLEGVQEELDVMVEYVNASKSKKGSFTDLFRGKNFKAFYIVCALMFFQQFAGITAVMFYLTEIFNAAKSNLEPAYATIIVAAVQFLASLMTQFIMERLGRRILLMVSSCGSAIGLTLLGLYFLLDEINSPIVDSINFLPLLSLVLYMIMFCWGMGVLPWAVIGEILPIEVKDFAAPIATAFYWALSFLITRYFSAVAKAAGMYVVFWIFAANCIICFFFGLFVLPETKDKSYNEIQEMLAGRDSEKELI